VGKLIRAQEIREVNDVQYRLIPVPEWGGEDAEIRIRSMSAGELVKFTNLKGENAKQGMVRALVMCAVDEDGERIFTTDDVAWLMDKNISVLHRIQDAILELNGMRKAAESDEDDDVTRAGKG